MTPAHLLRFTHRHTKHCPALILHVNEALKSMKMGAVGSFPQLKNTDGAYHLHPEWIWAANDCCKIHRGDGVGGWGRPSFRLEWVLLRLFMTSACLTSNFPHGLISGGNNWPPVFGEKVKVMMPKFKDNIIYRNINFLILRSKHRNCFWLRKHF